MKGILFLCTGNSCRSQMAEGFAKKMLPEKVKVFSAGIEPKGIHPMAIKVMQEVGIDISKQKSESLADIPIDELDLVVTLCGDAAERCPVFLGGVKRVHWALEDPAKATGTEEEVIGEFRVTRELIKNYIENERELQDLLDSG